jgi:arylsulfatase A-like enzyme
MRTLLSALALAAVAADRPNVLLVITDDQGYGDLGLHGNPVLKTPRLDALAGESARLDRFWAYPVCSPTRAGLLTGRHPYRGGVVDTFVGRSMLRPGVPTLADRLSAAGYRTGLFGKWHLGDTFPLRPEDRGFDTTLWHQGGGLAQPADDPRANPATAYFDPYLTRDGQPVREKGYCTDVFTAAAEGFIRATDSRPFFAYVAYNAPHDPLQVPPAFAAPYRGVKVTDFPTVGQPWAGKEFDPVKLANAYGMVANLDANVGKLLDALPAGGRNTVVVFLTDNGPGGVRFNAGLRGRKGQVYDGGLRVPCFVRWPGHVSATTHLAPTAVIDLMPTLLAAAGTAADPRFPPDGVNLLPLLTGGPAPADRFLFAQWHRGNVPEQGRAFAARGPRFKLAKPGAKAELFDLVADPFETTDLSAKLPDEAAKLQAAYDGWFADVCRDGFAPPRIPLGHAKSPAVRLTRQDWRGADGWGPKDNGHWEVDVVRAGRYRVGGAAVRWVTPDGRTGGGTGEVVLPAGPCRLSARPAVGQMTVEWVN